MAASISPQLRQRLLEAARAAEADYSTDLTVQSLAEYVGVSDKHFQRSFREVLGESPKKYIRRIRLQVAAYLLKWSDLAVTDVAAHIGFDTHAGFSKAFAKAYGMSPLAFRKAAGVAPYLIAPPDVTAAEEPVDLDRLEASKLSVRIEQTPSRRVAAMRHIGPTESAAEVWPQMADWARRRGLFRDDAIFLGVHNDYWDANSEDRYRYDAAVVVPADFEPDEEVITFEMPGGRVAKTEFSGGLQEADNAWRRFVDQWLPISGHTLRLSYAYDQYPADLVSAGPLRQILQTLTGIRATLCLPIV